MSASVGDEVIYQNRPAVVVATSDVAGTQWDTLLFQVPQVLQVPDSQVQTAGQLAEAKKVIGPAPAGPVHPGPARPGRP